MPETEKMIEEAITKIAFSEQEKTSDRLKAMKMLLDERESERRGESMRRFGEKLDAIAENIGEQGEK